MITALGNNAEMSDNFVRFRMLSTLDFGETQKVVTTKRKIHFYYWDSHTTAFFARSKENNFDRFYVWKSYNATILPLFVPIQVKNRQTFAHIFQAQTTNRMI
ncbi:uncharacterized protein PHALS_14537 [Plasmopara halstedii]|uniref:Uncharacterized protein n=1 Tax=Plasmopara halstedii TaxID=4781 RepID=A0A0P1AKR2_PLAHL|nr:uncharacterized protein PHALS_14537 [Plasmopara halstedii]CEG41470.1 hypothetical protein PHALS_14537 [Plasmopara halstedii]|eukprot:XP_024577839.1 hypothetical protein PHALS_14537 [Plasmopara halstedii]